MPLPSIPFILGLCLLFYLFTFVIFAVVQIATGVSIQRVGYSGFRRISFSPRDGIRINIRGLGASIHRPTYTQPTWFSINLTELQIALDLRVLSTHKGVHASGTASKSNGSLDARDTEVDKQDLTDGQSRTWKILTEVKEKIKRLHRQIRWIQLVDLVVTATTVDVLDVGSIRIERITLSVDTRRKTIDKSRLFQHNSPSSETRNPAEWKSLVRSVLFTPEGREATEILDYGVLNVHGMLVRELDGLRDASIAIKLGRVNMPYDDVIHSLDQAKRIRVQSASPVHEHPNEFRKKDESTSFVAEELVRHGSTDKELEQTVSESKQFVASILRGIQEIQFAVGFVGLSRSIRSVQPTGRPVCLNIAMKEVGLDLLRLDSRSPAHRMYFAPHDTAHEGLLTAISISAGLNDGQEHLERLMYVPMVTMTVKTTLPSKTIEQPGDRDVGEMNANILFSNVVLTSPSIDLDPKHLSLVLALLKSRRSASAIRRSQANHFSFSRLLPKASLRVSIQTPVIRVALPPMDRSIARPDDYDLLISSVASISIELESYHSAEGEIHYASACNYRVSNHQLYYQTMSGAKHNLVLNETVELKIEVNAAPELAVFADGRFQTLSVFLVRPEICEGIRQIVSQLHHDVLVARQEPDEMSHKSSLLRRLPHWLQHVKIQGSDFNIELAGLDEPISKQSRGFALQLESWTTEYKANREDLFETVSRRKSVARPLPWADGLLQPPPSNSPRGKQSSATDGRRLTVHLNGFEGYIVDGFEASDAEPFMSLPRFETAFSTSTDKHGPIFHINSHAKAFYLQYSLYNHFAIGLAIVMLNKTFAPQRSRSNTTAMNSAQEREATRADSQDSPVLANEITTLDFKASLLQIKAQMPADPPLMLQIFGLDGGRHRWAAPFLRTRTTRFYAQTPSIRKVWSRIVSVKGLRIDLRDVKRKVGKNIIKEKSLDIVTEAIRLGVPHSLVVHSIFDNVTNVVKTVAQLQHHFKTGAVGDALAKKPEEPKNVPKISIRSQVVIFEIDDSAFEWKIGLIHRVGLIEQKQRLARAEVFRLKVKKLEERDMRRSSSRYRAQSAHTEDRSRTRARSGNVGKIRSKSHDYTGQERSPDHPDRRPQKMRYDTKGTCGIGDASHRTAEQAWEKLLALNGASWKKRIDRALEFQNGAMKDMRSMFWGLDELPDDVEQCEPILSLAGRPALLAACISDLNITVDKPSFPVNEYATFLHKVGKGMPHDMKYSLLIPMNLQVSMGEAQVQLRDYPLPLIHVPAIRPGQSPRLPSLSLRTDFVIAEEFRGIESQRHCNVVVLPKEKLGPKDNSGGFSIGIRRTIAPVKTYSDMKVEINTSYPTKITWGTSYQPAIQDAMQVIEGFTKPAIDPSDRVGFWDKVRLSFHSRVRVAWKGDGDVHLILKGSRDPYVVTGQGAGFVMVWRNDVCWNIAQDSDPRKFMTVDSGDYILAVPDFNHYARHGLEREEWKQESSFGTNSVKKSAVFKKVVMKLSGNVRWMAGLVFEREVEGKERSFDICHHWDVVLKNPKYAMASQGKTYDAFRKFRSHHIHMSIAIAAPHDRDWSVTNLKPSSNYNTVHLSPRAFHHFFQWWSMFSGVMSLPVRQGPLWGGQEKSSKKFGRHLATIKYNLLLSPLYIAHIYKHKDAEDYSQDVVSATGLKLRLDSFMLDLHQRRETFEIEGPVPDQPKKTSGMKINQCQLDFISADIRAVSSSIAGTSSKDLEEADEETLASYQNPTTSVDMSKFTIPDNDFRWIDMDDFVELDWTLPAESNPETKILPLGCAPRFTYFRQTDHGDSISGDTTRSSPFGNEPTHFCVMSARNDPRLVQCDLIRERLRKIEQQIEHNGRAMGEQELRVVRDATSNAALSERLDALRNHSGTLRKKQKFLERMLKTLLKRVEQGNPTTVSEFDANDEIFEPDEPATRFNSNAGLDSALLADYSSDFNNRFFVHNAQIKWNNSLRNIILRYIHQVSQRRGFVYYMSRRAVKFILDIVDEQTKSKTEFATPSDHMYSVPTTPLSPEVDDDMTVQDRIDQLLNDGRNFVNADDPDDHEGKIKSTAGRAGDDIAIEFTPQNTFHFRLIAPQIQLQSEKSPKSAVLVTAKGMQLKVIQIMDKDRVLDDVSGLVQRRFSAVMDSLQVYVTNTKTFSNEYLHMYSGNRYGAKAGTFWPPWVPLEVMFEFQINPYGFSRVVHRTSASLRYDKFNTLRLKYNDDVSGGDWSQTQNAESTQNRMDRLWIEFPHFKAICDSAQYYAMYVIVLDLLLYTEPLEKTRSERLEKIMLASDFSDLTGAPEMVIMLQERISQLEEIKLHFQVNEKYLDRQGWQDRIAMDQDLASCEDELFFMMKAITTSQRRAEDRGQQQQSTALLHWYISAADIAWHLIRGEGESLLEFQLKNASYDRTDHNDGSNYNSMEIGRINGLNLLPDALYPEIIAPYLDNAKGITDLHGAKMLRVHWLMLEAIAGIPVVDHFEVDLVPLKVQLERDVAKKLFEYIFPGIGGNAFEGGSFSPLMVRNILPTQEEEDESDAKRDEEGNAAPPAGPGSEPDHIQGNGTGAGTLEYRLQPTLGLPDRRPKSKDSLKPNGLGIRHPSSTNLHHWGFFQHSNSSRSTVQKKQQLGGIPSSANRAGVMSRSTSERSLVRADSTLGQGDVNKTKRFPVRKAGTANKKKYGEGRSDDLTQMMNRASNYMTLAYVKIPSMVLCLSYKGKGQRNLEDVHDLVFRMPTLEYRNKTWSNLDLALQLKKDVIRALISHAGAIVGNKLSHHRPNRQQQSRLREIANSSTLMSVNGPSNAPSESSSVREYNTSDEPSRRSFTSGVGSQRSLLSPSVSMTSSSDDKSTSRSGAPSVKPALMSEGPVFATQERPPEPDQPVSIKFFQYIQPDLTVSSNATVAAR
ncbi:Protein SABRE [Elasticomyces elasticus]|nr:Protein SABRE [Elasticomyces elasticus]